RTIVESPVPTAAVPMPRGAALELETNLALERVELHGGGVPFNGIYTGALRNVANFNSFTGLLVLFTDSVIGVDSGSQLTIGTRAGLPGAGFIAEVGSHGFTKELAGTLVLNTANTYNG